MQPEQQPQQPNQWQQPPQQSGNISYGTQQDSQSIDASHQPPQVNSVPEVTPQQELQPQLEAPQTNPEMTQPVSWVAKEYTTEQKTPLWYLALFLIATIMMAFAIWKGSITFIILIPLMVVALFVYQRRPPQQIQYSLTTKGLYINDRLFAYNQFKYFGMIQKPQHYTVTLVPIKRFSPALTFDFTEEVGEKIIDMLGSRLPMQDIKPDAIDKLLAKIKL